MSLKVRLTMDQINFASSPSPIKRHPFSLVILRACGLKSCLSVMALLAMSSAAAQVPRDAPQDQMESIIITAPLNRALEVNAGGFGARQKMEVPLIIENYGTEVIHSADKRTVADVLTVLDPSITSSSYGGGFDNFRLRGFSGDLFNTLRMDGLALAPHQDMPLELVDRVDVLKGPAGFLYGINSPGGTINYLPKRPTRDPFTQVSAQLASLKGRHAAIDTSNSAFDRKLGFRLNAGYEKIGDFDHLGDLERRFAGLTTDIKLDDSTLLQLSASWSKKDAMADPLLRADQSRRTDPFDPATYVLPPRVNRRDALSPSWFHHSIEATNADAKLEHALNSRWTAIVQGNFSRVRHEAAYNDLFDIQPNGDIGSAALAIRRGSRYDSWSIQSYLSGVVQAGDLLHEVFFGASHHMNHDRAPVWDINESGDDVRVDAVSVGNILDPRQPARIQYGAVNDVDFNSNIQESSAFASDLISWSETFQTMLGGRYIRFHARNQHADATPERKSIFVPTVALMWRPASALPVMAYLSHSRGLERGEYAPYNADNAFQSTNVIQSRQHEIGLKIQPDRNTRFELALFDLQRDAAYLNASNLFVSSGKYQHRGIELSATTQPLPRLTLSGNLAYLDTRLKQVDDPTTRGKRSAGAPRWKGVIQVRYALAALPGLSVDSTLNYVGRSPVDAQNSGFIPAYALWHAGISHETRVAGLPTTIRLQGRNLGDRYYYPGVNGGGLQIGRGREIFLSAQLRF